MSAKRWDRDALLERYLSGATYQDLGDEFGVSRERIRQVLEPTREQVRVAAATRRKHEVELFEQFADDIRQRMAAGEDRRDIAKELGVPEWFVVQFSKNSLSDETKIQRKHVRGERLSDSLQRYTNDDIMAAIKEIAAKLGVDRLGSVTYERERDPERHPNKVTIIQRIGWNKACQMAGLEVFSRPVRTGERDFTDEQLFAALERMTNELGHIPTSFEYSQMRLEDEPSYSTVRFRITRNYTDGGAQGWPAVVKVFQKHLTHTCKV